MRMVLRRPRLSLGKKPVCMLKRRCKRLRIDYGIMHPQKKEQSIVYMCTVGGFHMTYNRDELPQECRTKI